MKIKSLLVVFSIFLLLTGCSKITERQETGITVSTLQPGSDTALPPLTAANKEDEAENQETAASSPAAVDALELCLDLLGKTDEESVQYFDGGETNYTADKTYLIGRIYQARIFDEEAVLYTSYSAEGRVDLLIIELKEQEQSPEYYLKTIENFLGQSASSDGGLGDDGSNTFIWEKDGKLIYLYNANGQITIQMLVPTEM